MAVGLLWGSAGGLAGAGIEATAPTSIVNVELKADDPPATVVVKEWYFCDTGNACTARTRAAVSFFRLAAVNLLCVPGAERGELRWASRTFPEQALKYGREALWFFEPRQITPESALAKAAEVVALAAQGPRKYWDLDRHVPYRVPADALPGQEARIRLTAYAVDDLAQLMKAQAEGAIALIQAAETLRKQGAKQ